jgi:SAM-dependent methyltransferase
MVRFVTPGASHQHSLNTLNALREYDDFMESIQSVCDMGCGDGDDLEWWATASTRDDPPRPLNIRCVGIDQLPSLPRAKSFVNMTYQKQDFESPILHKKKFDLLWCHDSFQFAINPLATLRQWRDAAAVNGMMILILPQTTNVEFRTEAFDQPDFTYYHWTMTSLIHALAVTGWDCSSGYFLKQPNDPWLHAIVYNTGKPALDPKTTRWYDLADAGLLPASAVSSVKKHGFLRQRDLVLPWLDKSNNWLGRPLR